MGELIHLATDLDALVAALRPLYDDWGYLIVGLGAYFENTILLGLFFPGGTMVLLGAFYSRLGTLALWLVLLLATLGTVTGALTDYAIGRLGVYRAIEHTWAGKRIAPHLPTAHKFLSRHGAWAVMLGHFAGQARSGLALAAGTTGFSWRRYALYEIAAAFVYNLLYCVLGYVLADNLDYLEHLLHRIGVGVWIIVAVIVFGWLGWRLLQRQRGKSKI